jgi:hypothetical protein
MHEDDPNYEPEGEVFIASPRAAGPFRASSRAAWMRLVLLQEPALKPPPWWLEQQDSIGRVSSKFMIWHHRYNLARKLSIWLMAPLDDFRRAGYLVRA